MSQTAGLSSLESESQFWNKEGDGHAGVRGRRNRGLGAGLVPQLVACGHEVTATTTGLSKLGLLEQLGADAVVTYGLDAVSVGEAVAGSRFAERMLTVIATCRQQGRQLLAFLVAAGEATLRGTPAPSLLSVQ